MHRRIQFGMRENPAFDRRHGSRPAIPSVSNATCIEEENATPPPPPFPQHDSPAVHSELRAASRHAGTGREIQESTERVLATGQLVQVRGKGISQTDTEFEPLPDVSDAATLLRVHPKTPRPKAAREVIPGIQIGRIWSLVLPCSNDESRAVWAWDDRNRSGLHTQPTRRIDSRPDPVRIP